MTHKLVARLAPLATPQCIRAIVIALTLIAAFAAPHAVQAQAIGGGCGG